MYLLRVINSGLTNDLFFGITGHWLTVVGTDGSYTKPFTVEYIMIALGQTMDVLLKADHELYNSSNTWYYMVARTLSTNTAFPIDNSTATAILVYTDAPPAGGPPDFPNLPAINDSAAGTAYTAQLKSLGRKEHPVDVPMHVDVHMLITIAINELTCAPNELCQGPQGNRLAASLNNVSFETLRRTDILGAYYHSIAGVHKTDFQDNPLLFFNFTGDDLPTKLRLTKRGTKVKVLEYGAVVEVVFQDTSLLGAENHPMHLHRFNFYVVGRGLGNFDKHRNPSSYNLVDPPYQNTVSVPRAGWAAIRFRARNPGVWFMHCHFERHAVWGMETAFTVKNVKTPEA